jgi:hypothetical protein
MISTTFREYNQNFAAIKSSCRFDKIRVLFWLFSEVLFVFSFCVFPFSFFLMDPQFLLEAQGRIATTSSPASSSWERPLIQVKLTMDDETKKIHVRADCPQQLEFWMEFSIPKEYIESVVLPHFAEAASD